MEDYELTDRYDEVAYWYNGYLFGGKVIYNPWSVLNYVASQDKQPRSYWVNTGSTEILERLVTRNGRELRQELGQLLEGQTITRTIHDNIVMRDIDTHENLMWSFLLFSGYLKIAEQLDEEHYTLQIPNREVELIYRAFIRTWFEKKVDLAQLEDMLRALQEGDVRLFEHTLRRVVLEVMSYHDLSGEAEKVYQALVLGMLVWLSDAYMIRSNRESGYGRYDMIFIPKDLSQQGIIIEFKRVYEDEAPETVLERALQQIQDKQYATEMHTAGVDNILQLAVAFRGKEIWVKKGAWASMPRLKAQAG